MHPIPTFAARIVTLCACVAFAPVVCLEARAQNSTPAQGAPPTRPAGMVVDDAAGIQDWFAPVYPVEALAADVSGKVVLRIVLGVDGAITTARVLTSSRDARLDEAAMTAMKQWKFTPATDGGKPTMTSLDVPFVFDAAKTKKSIEAEKESAKKGKKVVKRKSFFPPYGEQPMPSTYTAPVAKSTPAPDYPDSLKARRLSGAVRFSCKIGSDGKPNDVKILGSSHPDFVLPALAAIGRWEYTPAKQGDAIVERGIKGSVEFDSYASKPLAVFRANGITGPEGADSNSLPQLLACADAVWPLDLLLEGTSGDATVHFVAAEDGAVKEAKVITATKPEFGASALAAIERWEFQPVTSDGRPEATPLTKKFVFTAPSKDAKVDATDVEAVLVGELREGKIGVASGLDERLTPIYRAAPFYPTELLKKGKPAGAAEIEFVIARDGRARLPNVITASQPEFGWAAATAVAQWVFKAPLRGGKPVDVKVRIPISFASPE